MKIIICLIGMIVCFAIMGAIESDAISVMHQTFGALWGIMGTMFLCTSLIINSLGTKDKINTSSNKKSILEEDEDE